MDDDLRIVFESRNRTACADRSLVLAAAGIPHQVLHDPGGSLIVVPADSPAESLTDVTGGVCLVNAAIYDEANPPRVRKPTKTIRYQNAIPGIAAYALTVCAVAWLAGESAFGENWFRAGRVDGVLIRGGEPTVFRGGDPAWQ